jgi:frizzled protein 1/7
MRFFLILLIILGISGHGRTNEGLKEIKNSASQGKCEKITVPVCKDIQYNETMLPNVFNHTTQEEAGIEVHNFFPLVKVQCSRHLKLFLCTMYLPMCTASKVATPPCKSLCNKARTGCDSLLQKFGMEWPDNLRCDQFPTSGICFEENGIVTLETTKRPGLEGNSIGGGSTTRGGDVNSKQGNNNCVCLFMFL